MRAKEPGAREANLTGPQWDSLASNVEDGDTLSHTLVPYPLLDREFANCTHCNGLSVLSYAHQDQLRSLAVKLAKKKKRNKKLLDKDAKRKANLKNDIISLKSIQDCMKRKQEPIFSNIMEKCMFFLSIFI